MCSLKSRGRAVCARSFTGTCVLLRCVWCVFSISFFADKKGEKHKLATLTVMPQSQSYT